MFLIINLIFYIWSFPVFINTQAVVSYHCNGKEFIFYGVCHASSKTPFYYSLTHEFCTKKKVAYFSKIQRTPRIPSKLPMSRIEIRVCLGPGASGCWWSSYWENNLILSVPMYPCLSPESGKVRCSRLPIWPLSGLPVTWVRLFSFPPFPWYRLCFLSGYIL